LSPMSVQLRIRELFAFAAFLCCHNSSLSFQSLLVLADFLVDFFAAALFAPFAAFAAFAALAARTALIAALAALAAFAAIWPGAVPGPPAAANPCFELLRPFEDLPSCSAL